MTPSISRRTSLAALLGAIPVACLASHAGLAAVAPSPPKRGVNLSHWFAQSYEPLSADHFAHFVTLDALQRIASAGFDHVRLCIDPDIVFETQGPTAFKPGRIGDLDRALAKIRAARLNVIVDLHPVGGTKNILQTPAGAARFVTNWGLLAAYLAEMPARSTYFEVLNEPSPLEGDYWWRLQARALAAIRAAAGPAIPVIVNAGGWSAISDLVQRQPYPDPNLVYTVHYYSPLLFTHQATTWSWKVATRVNDLGWPVDAGAATDSAKAATTDKEAETFVHDAVASGSFSRAAMQADVDKLSDWQRRAAHVPIYVGEFGVYAKSAPKQARLNWMRATREAFAAQGWGWSVWDASETFGFYSDASRKDLDPDMMMALGVSA